MKTAGIERVSILKQNYIIIIIEQFLMTKRAENLSQNTQDFYKKELTLFHTFTESRLLKTVEDIHPEDLRAFLLWLEQQSHNPGGIHAAFRAMKTFMLWYESEFEPENWKNPIRKVKAPKLAKEPIQGIEITSFEKLLAACTGRKFNALRDKALFLFLFDTGARANEALDIDLPDCDLIAGKALIRQGKGRKPRTVYIGRKTRKAIRQYLGIRADNNPALWLTDDGDRLGYTGLRLAIQRRALRAGLAEIPTPHDFRRAFALEFLRAGGDIFTLQRLMGHADIAILRTYLAQTDTDIQDGHNRYGPVDRL